MRITPSTLPTRSRNSEVSLMEVGYPEITDSDLSRQLNREPETTNPAAPGLEFMTDMSVAVACLVGSTFVF